LFHKYPPEYVSNYELTFVICQLSSIRGAYMDKMACLYPQYGYEKHNGYPTKAHRELVLKYGPLPFSG